MRTLRNLTATVAAAIALAGLGPSTAIADVEVLSPDTFTLEGRLDFDTPQEHENDIQTECNVDLTMDVYSDGSIDVTAVDSYGYFPNDWSCYRGPGAANETWFDQHDYDNDCADGDNGWYGQILGPGDEWDSGQNDHPIHEYTGTGDFEAVVVACPYLHHFFYGSPPPFLFRFPIDTLYNWPVSDHEVWSLPEQSIYYWEPSVDDYTITGTDYDDPADNTYLHIETVQ